MLRRLDYSLRPDSSDLLHLDMLRIIAAFGIVFLHFRTNLFGGCDGCDVLVRRLDGLSLFVDLFFVISGIVITHVYGDRIYTYSAYRAFIVKRVARLGPLHWLTLLFFVCVGLAVKFGGVESDRAVKYDFGCLIQNFALVHAWGTCSGPSFNTVSWSISAEMSMYLIFPALFIAVKRFPLVTFLSLLSLLAVLYTSFDDEQTRWYEWTFHFGVIRALPAFALGVLLCLRRDMLRAIPAPTVLMLVCMAAFFAAMLLGVAQSWLVLTVYLSALFAFAADVQERRVKLVSLMAPYGQLTYSMYMLHPVMQALGITLIGEMLLKMRGEQLGWWTLFCLLIMVPVSYASLVVFERPARDYLARFSRSGEAAHPVKAEV